MTANSPAVRAKPPGNALALTEAEKGVFERCGVEVLDCGIRFTDPDLPFEEMEGLAGFLGRGTRWFAWAMGDLLVAAETMYGEVFAQLEHITGLAPQTLMNRRSIAAGVPQSVRRPFIGLSVHAEVAALKPNAQRHWLARVEKERLTREELRGLLREERTEDLPLGETTGRTDNGGPPSGEAQAAAGRSPVGSSVDAVLAAIRAVTEHAVPLDAKMVAVRRKDLENLQAFLGDE